MQIVSNSIKKLQLSQQTYRYQQSQEYQFQEQVHIKKLRNSSVNKFILSCLDCTNNPEKLSSLITTCTFPQHLQKLNLSTCSISSLAKIFKTNNKRRNINISLSENRQNQFNYKKQHVENNEQIYQGKYKIAAELKQQNKWKEENLEERMENKLPQNFIKQFKLENLKQLILDNNQIQSIPYELINKLKALKKLTFNNNLVSILPDFSQHNADLVELQAKMNPISSLEIISLNYYIKIVQFDWLNYIDIDLMKESRHRSNQWSNNKFNQSNENNESQNQLSNTYRHIILSFKKQNFNNTIFSQQKQSQSSLGLNSESDNNRHHNTTKIPKVNFITRINENNASNQRLIEIGFTQFFNRFKKLSQDKINQNQFQLLIVFNLRKAILTEFYLFINYCYSIVDQINFNQLKFKGNYLIQYALDNEYQYAILLFIQKKQNLIKNQSTWYQTLILSSKFSHYKLFKLLINLAKQSKHIKQSKQITHQINNNFIINQGTKLASNNQQQLLILNKNRQNLSINKHNIQHHHTQVTYSTNPLIQYLFQPLKYQELSDQNLQVSLNSTRFYNVLMEILFHFKSNKMLEMFISLLRNQHQNVLNNRIMANNQITYHYDNFYQINQPEYSQSIFQKKSTLKSNQNLSNDQAYFQKNNQSLQAIQIPGNCQFSQLTRDQIQSFCRSIVFITQNPKLSPYFKIKQQNSYQKQKIFLQVVSSIKNNQLLLLLLWKFNFNIFNRNYLGRIPRTGRVLISNKKLLYQKQLSELQKRFAFIQGQQAQQIQGKHNKKNKYLFSTQSNNNSRLKNKNKDFMQNQPIKLKSQLYKIQEYIYSEPIYFNLRKNQRILFNENEMQHQNPITNRLKSKKIKLHNNELSIQEQNQFQTSNKKIQGLNTSLKKEKKQLIKSDRFQKDQVLQNDYLSLFEKIQKQITIQNKSKQTQKLNCEYQLFQQLILAEYLRQCKQKNQQYFNELKPEIKSNESLNRPFMDQFSKNLLSCTCVQLQQQQHYVHKIPQQDEYNNHQKKILHRKPNISNNNRNIVNANKSQSN